MLCGYKCGICSIILLANISEYYCCSELEGSLESMKSDLVLEDLVPDVTLKCITEHQGFNPVCLQKWSLRLATAKFKTKGKQQYRKNGSEERLVIKRGNRPKASKKHCSTDVNKTKEVRKIAKSTASNLDVTLENVQKLVDSFKTNLIAPAKLCQHCKELQINTWKSTHAYSLTQISQEGSNGNRKRLIYPAESATKNNPLSI